MEKTSKVAAIITLCLEIAFNWRIIWGIIYLTPYF
jgi:hypothetical protein